MFAVINMEHKWTAEEDSIITKDWAAGSNIPAQFNEFILTDKETVVQTTVEYAQSWYTVIDEPIVNALDWAVKQYGKVTQIKIDFTPEGRVRITNNGPGLDVEISPGATIERNKETYVPTMYFACMHQGTNQGAIPGSITGGTNGIGAKVCNIYSAEFIIETVDSVRGKYFSQVWRNHRKQEEPPRILAIAAVKPKERASPHTTVSFIPDYSIFGNPDLNSLLPIIRTRAMWASIYANYISKILVLPSMHPAKISVLFNGSPLRIKTLGDLAHAMFPGQPQVKTTITPDCSDTKLSAARKLHKYEWDCCVVPHQSAGDQWSMSVVNGIVVDNGSHIRRVRDLIVEGVRAKIAKQLKSKNLKFHHTHITNNLFILLACAIPNPAWVSQTKDPLSTDIRTFAHYSIPAKAITAITKLLEDRILSALCDVATPKTEKVKVYTKYRPARLLGRMPEKCALIMFEGDSAMDRAGDGLARNGKTDFYGLISSGGVPVNARKHCKISKIGTSRIIVPSAQFGKNKFVKYLFQQMGLDMNYKYDPSSTTFEKEWAEIKYKRGIIACVDQDVDGKGQILGLMLNMFQYFWPHLINAGFFKWLPTPIQRAYPKSGGKVLEFYTLREFEISGVSAVNYTIQYYKGIGTHNSEESANMFKNFETNLRNFNQNTLSDQMFEVFFGIESGPRKIELAKPLVAPSDNYALARQRGLAIELDEYLLNEVKEYQLDNIDRKLDSWVDGQNQVGRKILYGLFKICSNSQKLRITENLGNQIAGKTHYTHGPTSLTGALTGKGLVTCGGKQLPFIVPYSNFGSRKCGGAKAAAPRYTKSKFNARLVGKIFPAEFFPLVPYNFDEDERSEPKFFISIIPMAILESTQIPGTGWKLTTFARDVYAVIDLVTKMISANTTEPVISKLPPCVYANTPHAWKGTIEYKNDTEYSIGDYWYDEKTNIVHVNELPLRTWTSNYVSAMQKSPFVAAVDDYACTETTVDIKLKLVPNAIDELEQLGEDCFDGIQLRLGLAKSLCPCLNMIGTLGEVSSFATYEEIIPKWFANCKHYYKLRVERKIVLMELNLQMMENRKRYLMRETSLSKKPHSEIVKILADEKYDKICLATLKSPKFIPTEKLREVVTGKTASYEYLLKTTDNARSAENIAEYATKCLAAVNELNEYKQCVVNDIFPGASIWLEELKSLLADIKLGQSTNWKYHSDKKFEFDA